MKLPINETLRKYENHISFHTPAHSGVVSMGEICNTRLDVTELSYSDNLLVPENVILESEREVARVYGTQNVIFSTAGATTLVHTAIATLANRGSFLIVGNAHKSVFSALRIARAQAVVFHSGNLRETIRRYNVKNLVITSPSYYGNVPKEMHLLRELRDSCDVKIICDASHGSHFAFSDKLPVWESDLCDIVIHSLHKTLPVMTGGAIMHVSDELISRARILFSERHTTSPSYPVLCSIEWAVNEFENKARAYYEEMHSLINEFKLSIKDTPFSVLNTNDFSRLVIVSDYDGGAARDYLESVGIYPEMSTDNRVVFIVTPYNMHELKSLASALINAPRMEKTPYALSTRVGESVITFYDEFESVSLNESIGRVSYREVGAYPPGTPLVYSGETISEELVGMLKLGQSTFGLDKGNILVVK